MRWALDRKRLPHVRHAPIPGVHVPIARVLTGQPRMPILELDGRRIADSTRIIAALEAHAPDPPLHPADAAEPSGRCRPPRLPRSLPPEVQALREELTARPGGRWVHEMFARYRQGRSLRATRR